MTTPRIERVAPWVARAPDVPAWWFRRASRLHGENHTRRVHVHAQRLLERLRWDEADARLVLRAALWHDIGRETDGVEPPHGARGAARADELGLTAGLASGRRRRWSASPSPGTRYRTGAPRHKRPSSPRPKTAARRLARPERALRILWLLKDADALDRVRLGFGERADPRQLRHPEAIDQIGFADRAVRGAEVEAPGAARGASTSTLVTLVRSGEACYRPASHVPRCRPPRAAPRHTRRSRSGMRRR